MGEAGNCGRDARVDRIGYCQELWDQYAKVLKEQVKGRMERDHLVLVEGDAFEGRLAPGKSSEVQVEKFLRLFEEGAISRKDFLAAVKVSITEARKFMQPGVLQKMTITAPTAPSFKVERQKGVEISLVEAVADVVKAAAQ